MFQYLFQYRQPNEDCTIRIFYICKLVLFNMYCILQCDICKCLIGGLDIPLFIFIIDRRPTVRFCKTSVELNAK